MYYDDFSSLHSYDEMKNFEDIYDVREVWGSSPFCFGCLLWGKCKNNCINDL